MQSPAFTRLALFAALSLAILGCGALAPAATQTPMATSTPIATPTPAPPSGWISFDSARDGAWGIYATRADGTGEPVLISAHVNGEYWSAWSPDGKQIAFISARGSTEDGRFAIWIINADHTGLRPLTDEVVTAGVPAWSPDGQQIAFASARDGVSLDIFVVGVDGTGMKRILGDPTNEDDPSWSPDGSALLFESDRSGTWQVHMLTLADNRVVQLTTEGLNGEPTWAPAGNKIAFVSNRDGNAEIYVMDADGGGQTRVTHHEAGDQFPSWSPDGRYLAFASDRGGNVDVYVMNADGSGVTQITDDPGDDYPPRWSPSAASSMGGLENVLSEEPWFGKPQCQRDTDGDGIPDTPTTTFLTTDKVAYIAFLFGNMQDGMGWGFGQSVEGQFRASGMRYWDEGPAGMHVESIDLYSGKPGKLTASVSLMDMDISNSIECEVVSP